MPCGHRAQEDVTDLDANAPTPLQHRDVFAERQGGVAGTLTAETQQPATGLDRVLRAHGLREVEGFFAQAVRVCSLDRARR